MAATESEIERLVVRLVGDAREYIQMLKQAEKETKAAASNVEEHAKKIESFGDSIKSYAATAAGALAGLGTAAILKEAFGNFAEAESIGLKLNAALEANGRNVEMLTREYKDFADELERTTTLEDDQVLKLAQMAESLGVTGDQTKRAIRNAAALAAQYGGTADSFIRMTANLERGNLGRLAMLLGLGDEAEGAEKVAEAQEKLAKMYALVEAEAKTAAGALAMLKRDFGNALEDVGAFVAQGLMPVVQGLRDAVQWFRELDSSTKQYLTAAAALAGSLVTAIAGWKAISAVLGGISWVMVNVGISSMAIGLLKVAYAATAAAVQLVAIGGFAAIAAGVGYAFYQLGRTLGEVFYGAREATARFADELERAKQLAGRGLEIQGQGFLTRTAGIEALPADQRGEALKKEVESTEKHLAGLLGHLQAVEKQAQDTAPTILSLWQAGRAEWQVTNQTAEEYKAKIKQTKEQIEALKRAQAQLVPKEMEALVKASNDLTQKLQEQVKTFGMSNEQAALFKLQEKGASEEMLVFAHIAAQEIEQLNAMKKAKDEAAQAAKKLGDDTAALVTQLETEIATFGLTTEAAKIFKLEMEGLDAATRHYLEGLAEMKAELDQQKELKDWGERLTKEILGNDPVSKFAERIAELQDAFTGGAIAEDIFAMGVAQANKEMEDAAKKAEKAAKEIQKFDAAASGSAEARQRVQAFLDATAAPKKVLADAARVVAPVAEAFKPVLPKLGKIDDLPDLRRKVPVEKNLLGDARGQQEQFGRFDKMIDLLGIIAGKDPVILEGANLA